MHLLRLCLKPGEIGLTINVKCRETSWDPIDDFGCPRYEYSTPDVSIMWALNKYWLEHARNILYLENIWIMPTGELNIIRDEFFYHWHHEDLRLLPFVALRLSQDDIALHKVETDLKRRTWTWGPREKHHLFLGVWFYRHIALTDVNVLDDSDRELYALPDPVDGVTATQDRYALPNISVAAPRRLLRRPPQPQQLLLFESTRTYLHGMLQGLPEFVFTIGYWWR